MHASCTNTLLSVPFTYQAPVPLVIAQDGASNAHVPGPASAPCSVDVLLHAVRHVVVYDMLNAPHIDTPPKKVCGHHEGRPALLKGLNCLGQAQTGVGRDMYEMVFGMPGCNDKSNHCDWQLQVQWRA